MKLETLRSRLNQLRRRRAIVRQSTAWSAVILAVCWLVSAAFFVDWLLLMNVPQRLVAWGIGLGIAIWAFWHYTKPWLGVKEDVVDVALLVEKQQHIDSDLVAALQFQDRDAPRWGSPQLETAVIDYVEEFSPSLDVFEGFSYRRFKRRMAWLAGTLLVLVGFTLVFPDYAAAFANRMLLGSMRYPTDTQIERIAINGETVYLAGGEKLSLRIAYGTPVNFEVTGRGVLPDEGQVRLRSDDSSNHVTVDLNRGVVGEPVKFSDPSPKDDASLRKESASRSSGSQIQAPEETSNRSSGQAIYQGEMPRLVGTVTYQVFLGDTWSDPMEIEVIPLPVVTVSLDPEPPGYAVAGEEELAGIREGTRQISVIEGTSVALDLESTNKPLAKATLKVDEETYPLAQIDEDGRRWRLPHGDSPLKEIRQPVRYSLHVEDRDGLALEQPIEGFIRIRADRKPRIQPPDLVTVVVVPKAKPTMDFHVSDDYGLSRLAVKVQVVRKVPMPNGGSEEGADPESDSVASGELVDQVDHIARDMIVVDPNEQPKRTLSGRYALVLESFNLAPGDELKVTLEAFDYRGEFAPQSSLSEPLILKVNDEDSVVLEILKQDQRSSQSLDDIIEITSGDTK